MLRLLHKCECDCNFLHGSVFNRNAMKWGLSIAGFWTVVVAACSTSDGAVAEHPYAAIVERNAFGLRPIPPAPPPAQPEVPPPAPLPDIKLTGISTLLGEPQVFIEIIDPQTKKTERPPGLEAGEKQFDIEILAIDPRQGVVRVRNRGTEQTLDFVNNGIKPGAPSTAANAPANRGRVPAPAFSAMRPPPPSPIRSPVVPANPASDNSRAIVSGGPGGATTATPMNPGIPPDAEARIQAYRRLLERQQNGTAPVTPPTRLLPSR